MKLEIDLDLDLNKLAETLLTESIKHAVSQQVKSYVNNWQFQECLKSTIKRRADELVLSLIEEELRQTEEIRQKIVLSIEKKIAGKLVKQLTEI